MERLHQQDQMTFSQFAILVSDRFQGQRVAEFLTKLNIPVVLQRSSSLTDSSALLTLQELLHSLLHPKQESSLKIALGGRIIGWTHLSIRHLDDAQKKENIIARWQALRHTLFAEGFALLFETLLQSSWQENSTVAEHLLSQEGGASFYDDLCQLRDLLIEQESQQHATPEMLLKFLDRLATQANDDALQYKRQMPSNQNAIQILTLHASKGLEFDLVFPIGLITRPKPPSALLPVGTPPQLTVVNPASSAYAHACREIDAEKMRQFYVALTRAKYRLYLPVTPPSSLQLPELGSASPMELFLARLDQPKIADEQLYQHLTNHSEKRLMHFIDRVSPSTSITYSLLANTPHTSVLITPCHNTEILAPAPPVIPTCKLAIHSFTSLTKAAHHPEPFEETFPPHDFSNPIKSPHTLPAGSVTGTLLHRILETIPFQAVVKMNHPKEMQSLITPFIQQTPFAEWEEVISRIIFNALKTPLNKENNFILSEIPQSNRYQEIEFLFQNQISSCIKNGQHREEFFKGVIDLVVYYQNKYYVIDWKSNWLGTGGESYGSQSLQVAMERHHYLLQAEIYSQGLKQYLKLVDPRPFEEIFGGVYDLFLRGLGASNQGILLTI